MPEEATPAPAEEQETPAPAAPEEGTPAPPEPQGEGTPDIDYQKRFEDLQPELTKAQQQNAAFRRLLDAARQGDAEALEALGIDYEEPEEEFEDPDEALRNEVTQLREHLSTQQQESERAQLEEQEADYIAENIEALEKAAGIELDDEAVDFVIDNARANRGEDGAPSVEDAFKRFTGVLASDRERYLQSKKNAPKAPVGGPGEDDIDLSNDDERIKAMVRDMEAEGSE